MSQTAKKDLIITHIFNSPVTKVWDAWFDSEILMQWWGPDHFTCPYAKIDIGEGKISVVAMLAPQDFGGQLTYASWLCTEMIPQERFEYVHNISDKDGDKIDPTTIGLPEDFPQDLQIAVVFKDLGEGKTELIITEYEWPVGQMMEMSKTGMEQSLNKLDALLS